MLILFVGLACFTFSNVQATEYVCENFKCESGDSEHCYIKTGGEFNKYKCPENQECNIYRDTEECPPCVPKCNGKFECAEDTKQVIIFGSTINCPAGFECNKEFKGCNPCVEEACAEPKPWTCTDNPAVVVIDGVQQNCRSGWRCNKDNIQPCNPCIK